MRQRKLANNLTAVALLTTMLMTSIGSANAESKTCDQVLQLCNKALQDERQETEALKRLDHSRQRVVEAQEDHIKVQREKIDLLKSENESLLRSPTLWFGLGLITGVVLMKK